MKPSVTGVLRDWIMLLTGVSGFLWEIYAVHPADPVIVTACLVWAGVPASLAVLQGKLSSALHIPTTSGSSQPPSQPSSPASSSPLPSPGDSS